MDISYISRKAGTVTGRSAQSVSAWIESERLSVHVQICHDALQLEAHNAWQDLSVLAHAAGAGAKSQEASSKQCTAGFPFICAAGL